MTSAKDKTVPRKSREAPARQARIHLLDFWRKALLFPLSLAMLLWARTVRIRMAPEDRRLLTATDRPTVLTFWHNRLFLAPLCYRRFRSPRPTYCLVSASRDGAWLAALVALNGMKTVRGSSSRRGREALLELLHHLREGSDVAVTPDGPRGPAYSFKAGVPMLAGRARARVLLINAVFSSAWRLKSWDGFFLPKPFSSVTLRCEAIEPDAAGQAFGERATDWKRRLHELGVP